MFFVFFIVSCLLPCRETFGLEVSKKILPNGLTVLHSERHNLPIVMATMIVKSGVIDEPKEKSGLANLVSALLNEGTKTRKSSDISEEIEFIGASLNSSAESDYISITLSVLKKDIEKGFEIFSDIIINPSFPEIELKRKKDQIIGYLKQREEEPSFIAGRAFNKEVFGKHPYSRLVEGTPETIQTITAKDIADFHAVHFIPNNATLTIVGDLNTAELDVLLKKYFDLWNTAKQPKKSENQMPKEKNKKTIKIDKNTAQANIIMGHIGISRDNPDYYAVSVMNYILGGGGFSSRLMQTVRDGMGLAYDIHSFFSANKEKGAFQVIVQTKNESANKVIAEIIKQIEKIKKEKVSDQELADAKSYLTGSFPRRLETSRKTADFLAAVDFYNLGLDYAEKYSSYINSVSKEDILRVAKRYLDPERLLIVVVGNQEKIKLGY